MREVWPRLRDRVPAAALRVAGTVCERVGRPPPGVRLLGPVPDLGAEYHAAAVFVAPILLGSGLKIKLVEALAHGCPCVACPVGAEGLTGAVRVADGPAEFAAAVARLLTDPAEQLRAGAEAVRVAAERFSPAAAFGPLLDRLRRAARPWAPGSGAI